MTTDNKELPASVDVEFTDDELAAIRKEARKQIGDQVKAQKKAALLAQYKKEELGKVDPREELVDVTIDVPGFAQFICIDGTKYQQGETRQFTRKQAETIRDITANAWKHEKSVGDANSRQYRPPQMADSGARVGSNTVINSRYFARV